MKLKLLLALMLSTGLSTSALADGVATYTGKCAVCHATGIAGAPKYGDPVAWGPRIEKGVDALLATAISGKGAMPPRGTCVDCSDADLKAAIEHMINQVK